MFYFLRPWFWCILLRRKPSLSPVPKSIADSIMSGVLTLIRRRFNSYLNLWLNFGTHLFKSRFNIDSSPYWVRDRIVTQIHFWISFDTDSILNKDSTMTRLPIEFLHSFDSDWIFDTNSCLNWISIQFWSVESTNDYGSSWKSKNSVTNSIQVRIRIPWTLKKIQNQSKSNRLWNSIQTVSKFNSDPNQCCMDVGTQFWIELVSKFCHELNLVSNQCRVGFGTQFRMEFLLKIGSALEPSSDLKIE